MLRTRLTGGAVSSLTRWLFDNGTKATPLEGVSDQLYLRTSEDRSPDKLTRYGVLLVLSTAIATGGILTDSTATVIGAMIVAPLATPIQAIGLASVTTRPRQMRFPRYRVGERAYFRMTASNEVGAGPASLSTPLFAPTEARPGPVTNPRIAFRALPSAKVAASITWTPGDSGGLPQKFKLRVKVNGQDRVKNKTVSGTRFTVGNIPKKDFRDRPTNVFVSVIAENIKYSGPDTVIQEAYVPQ